MSNQHVRAARRLVHRRERSRSGAFLVEGPKLVAEASASLVEVFVAEDAGTAEWAAAEQATARGLPERVVSAAVLARLATTVTPQGIVGVAALASPTVADALRDATLAVLCAGVADPGNAGTVIRAADAAGADAVLLGMGSVDSRNPKAVRASAGSLFHLPVVDDADPLAAIAAARAAGMTVVAAAADGAERHVDRDLTVPTLLVLGGEAHGLSAEVQAACDAIVRVAMFMGERRGWTGRAESLNLAATAAVLCFEALRQRGGV